MTAKIPVHVLTFRCVNCGRTEALAYQPSEHVIPTEKLRTKIYQATCTACGWKSAVCGASALTIAFNAPEVKRKMKE